MRTKKQALLLTALALAVQCALAQQPSGQVWVTGTGVDVNGDNPFRFLEYRDIRDGVTGGMNLRWENSWYHNLFGENLGRDDQYVELKGGRYGVFKYSVYVDDVVHNLTYDAITPWVGIGTNNLTFAGNPPSNPTTNTALWTGFGYGIQHENIGGMAEVQPALASPLYFRAHANRKRTEGIRPLGAPATSPGGPTYELPLPVDFTTTDFGGEVGYSSKTFHAAASVAWSKFEDHNDFLNWRNAIVTTGANTERSTISTDNDMVKLGLNLMWKQLPMGSTLAVRGVYSKLEGDFAIPPTYLSVSGTTGNVRQAGANVSNFDGEVVNKSIAASFTSQLGRGFDSRAYLDWTERDNKSTHVVFVPTGPGSGGACDFNLGVALTTCSNDPFHYKRENLGLDLNYRLNRENKLFFNVDYALIERERHDFHESKETKFRADWKSSSLGIVDTRLRYEHFRRRSEFGLSDSVNIFDQFVYRFDAAPLDRDLVKVVFESSPLPLLDLGLEIIAKRNDYKDTVLGRTEDTRREIYLSASYGSVKALRLTAFADVEWTRYESTHWVGATTTFPVPNPAGTAYLWDAQVKDKNYLVGLAADYLVNERLKLYGSLIWQKTDGMVDFSTPANLANPQNIDAYDNFRKRSLNVKGTYAATKKIDVTLGAAYEKFEFSDVQIDGYLHALRTGTTQNYLSGAYAFPSYTAKVLYVTLAYRF
jgi:MtrB/PioB family decaheme-associated outer membrane protein